MSPGVQVPVREIRLVHLSDLHLWRIPRNPLAVIGKRLFGLANLASTRWRKHRKSMLKAVLEKAVSLNPDHAVISGDLTVTGLPKEFQDARRFLEPLLNLPSGATVIPGNHDRYSRSSVRNALFERHFLETLGVPRGTAVEPKLRIFPKLQKKLHPPGVTAGYPCLKTIAHDIRILSLDVSRPILWASSGKLPIAQRDAALALAPELASETNNLILVCHYPYCRADGKIQRGHHGVVNAQDVETIVSALSPALYLHGHTHRPGSYQLANTAKTWCLDAGSASAGFLIGGPRASFFEIRGVCENNRWKWGQRLWLLTADGWHTLGDLDQPEPIRIELKDVKRGRIKT